MRIAIFTEVFLPKIDGVVTRLTHTLRELHAAGHEVLVFAPGNPPATFAGFEVVSIPSLSLWPVYPELKWGLPDPRVLYRLRRFDADVVHVVNPIWTAALGVWAARREALPLVGSFHTNLPEYVDALGIGWVRPATEAALRYLHNQAVENLCTSDPMVERAQELGIRNVSLWPKAVDTDNYYPQRYSEQMRSRLTDGHPEARLVTYVGRVSKEKDLDRLPGIMARLREHVPGARLAVVGAGPYSEQLAAQFSPDEAVFTGYLSGDELAAAFACGDVFCFPSRTETLGLVALESFASGVPVVGTHAGGIPFVIDDGKTGLLVDDDASDSAWAEALTGVLGDAERRAAMGTAARAEAERWSWEAATRSLIETYQRAVDGPLYRQP
ncbi:MULTISPECIES: glycosyltransferase family 4 protein [unclassified Corynebacterium]|uniref:glycosyltransferase family 4 protein n=1 Tax=unclassified Corynebacterium TaxID=2624378 RepID=UPI0034CD56CD